MRTRGLLLWCAATDRTFVRRRVGVDDALVGKCLHCGTKLVVGLAGEALSTATVEHILPRHHGGTDTLENLGVACARCNATKGYRHDCQPPSDPTLRHVVDTLLERRRARMRPPLPGVRLPPWRGCVDAPHDDPVPANARARGRPPRRTPTAERRRTR
jgi:hypothetical protein